MHVRYRGTGKGAHAGGPRSLGTCVASPTRPEKNFEHISLNTMKPGFGEYHPYTTRGAVQSSFCCVLCTEALGRHDIQTLTQASPAVAESEARLAIGFLVVDNSGPEAADSKFTVSVMRKLRRPIRLCSRQMSRWMTTMKSRRIPPACSHITKERFAGWCILGSTLQLRQSV